MTRSVDPTPGSGTRLVAALGRADRGDDGFGPEVLRSLRATADVPARLVDCAPGALALLDLWEGVEWAWVVDAVVSGAPPGALHVLDGRAESLPPEAGIASTHGISLGEVVALARSLDRLPAHLTVYGVEAAQLGLGEAMSPPVRSRVEEVAACIRSEVVRAAAPPGRRELDHA